MIRSNLTCRLNSEPIYNQQLHPTCSNFGKGLNILIVVYIQYFKPSALPLILCLESKYIRKNEDENTTYHVFHPAHGTIKEIKRP